MTPLLPTPPDPLRVLKLPEVIERMGYSKRQVMRLLAEDRRDKFLGKRFPAPLKPRFASNRLEWRELDLVNWLESRKDRVS